MKILTNFLYGRLNGKDIVTFTYIFCQNNDEEFLDPVERLEKKMEGIEKLIGGLINVQSQSGNASAKETIHQIDTSSNTGEVETMAKAGPPALSRSTRTRQREV